MRDLVGETLSHRYRLVARVAGGGMGDVYRAHDLLLDRAVAVKVLQHSLANDPDLVERFRTEARAAARLTHPNIVAVHDWGSEDELTYYMVMEYVSGTDLRDILVSNGSLDPARAVEIVRRVCEALSAAHKAGLVHRDIKPENILVSRSGEVKVADFGIAAIVDAERTMPGGNIPGTLRYLSPEQARGGEASFASDIWAAGAVLSEIMTGAPPTQGPGDLLQRRATEPPVAPSSIDPSIPPEVDEVVLRACALDPLDRYHDASDMALDLGRAAVRSLPRPEPLEGLLTEVTGEIRLPDLMPTEHVPQRHRYKAKASARRKRRWLLAAALAVLLLVGGRAVASFVLPQMVEVPALVGLSKSDAQARAEDSGLEVNVAGREHHMEIERGAVVSQSPSAGELEEGSAIEVVLSSGPPKVRLLSLEGMERSEAIEKIEGAELAVGDIDEEYSLEPPGTVLSQLPLPGRVVVGTTVDLIVSKGPRPVEMPDVVKLDEEDAIAVLKDKGLVPVISNVYSDEVKPGKVVATDPAAQAIVEEGSEVTVSVSIGPEFRTFKMPDVRGLTVDDAKSRLVALGLRVTVDGCPGGSTVVETDPLAGTKVRENDVVALFAC